MAVPHPISQSQFYEGVAVKRLLAWLIDMVLIIAICVLIGLFTALIGFFFFAFLMIVVGFAYRVITLAGGSATWGMRAMAIELRDRHDNPLDTGTAFLHTLGYSISVSVFPLQLISVILMATSASKQGLTDLVLGTVALNRRRHL